MRGSTLLVVVGLMACEPDPETTASWRESFDAQPVGWLMSTWAREGGSRYAVGGAPDAGVVLRDGVAVDTGEAGDGVPLLNWVTGFGDELFVVGSAGTILRFDGAAWKRDDALTDQDLWGVWGASADDVWAVGGTTSPTGHPVILRFDGSSWTDMAVPTLQKAGVRAFFKVWGTARDRAFIIGQNGVVLRWDGVALHEEFVGASADLIGIWGFDDRVVMVGGRGTAIATTWDGANWRTQNLAPLSGLNGVWMRDPDTVHIAGTLGAVGILDFKTLVPKVETLSDALDFHAIHGDGSGLYAVGGSFRSPVAPFEGLAFERELGNEE